MPPRTYLDEILAAHRARAARDDRDVDALRAEASARPPTRGLREALARASRSGLAVVAEIKRRSPSKGDLDPGLDPAEVARSYEHGGAAAVSVLTDEAFFGGSPDDLRAARAACSLPVLRKDFTVSPADLCDARLMGADAALLIAAALSPAELAELHALGGELGLDVLVEVHDGPELERALGVGATLVGVNQRDLVTFEVDHDRAARLAGHIPAGVVAVAESGVRDAADARRLAEAGYDAVLVGETLMRSGDRAGALSALRGAPVAGRDTVPATGRR
ncbi:MAG: indole-3-glycerol phosphate synthase TrpC [Acidimicrobiales bacterium]